MNKQQKQQLENQQLSAPDPAIRRSNTVPNYKAEREALPKLIPTLKKLGYEGFRKGQYDIIKHVIREEDVLGILPTGSGKTACWLIPCLIRGWRVVVFSPTKSLMADQSSALTAKGIKAADLHDEATSSMNEMTLRAWESGDLQVLFTVVDRTSTDTFKNIMVSSPPDCVVIDEAHILAEWSGFRQFGGLGSFIRAHKSIKSVVALSATATAETVAALRVAGINNMVISRNSSPRLNLNLTTEHVASNEGIPAAEDTANFMVHVAKRAVERMKAGPVIVYCGTKPQVEAITRAVRNIAPPQANGKSPVVFYTGASGSEVDGTKGNALKHMLEANQRAFQLGDSPIMVATVAFGLGIDKADVRTIINVGIPKSFEEYVQSTGRGARDGGPCECIMMTHSRTDNLNRWLVKMSHPDVAEARGMLHLLKRSANDQGYFDIRNKDLATMLKVQDGQTSQIASALKKAGLLKVEEVKPVNAVFKFVKTESTPETGKRFGEYVKKLSQLPRREDGSTEANMEEIARLIGNEKDTVKKNLKTWAEAGFVEFTPPAPAFNRYTVKVDPDSAEVAEKLKAMTAQKKRAFSSLDAVTMISQVEGSGRKHAIIEQYYESSIREALAESEGGYSSGGLEDSAGSADE